MYQRFLNNNDYTSSVTEEALEQLIRGKQARLLQAEESAESSIVEYLTDNYEIEKELEKGKRILPYNDSITYPVGSHFYYQDNICQAIRSISSRKAPTDKKYWKEMEYDEEKFKNAVPCDQIKNYQPGDTVCFANSYFECTEYNGIDYKDIQVPGFRAWEKLETYPWEPNVPYLLWDVVSYDGRFYALTNNMDVDQTINPFDSDDWGLIGDYDPTYNEYELSSTEYVVWNGNVYYPIILPTSSKLVENYNYCIHDPRNPNIKKHMQRLAVYELHKLISPNNISSTRITDYETSIAWLRDAKHCRLNPGIPRKLDDKKQPVTEFAIATFMKDYNPDENYWQI